MTQKRNPNTQPTTGERCSCKPGIQRDNCPACEATGERIDFARIRAQLARATQPQAVSQHTPGPWQIIRQDGVDNCYLIRRRYETGGATNIALVNILARQFEVGDLTLIESAPTLLAEVTRLKGEVDQLKGWKELSLNVTKRIQDERDALKALNAELVRALEDMLGGWKYIRSAHGDLYGVGWDRAQEKAVAALAAAKGVKS